MQDQDWWQAGLRGRGIAHTLTPRRCDYASHGRGDSWPLVPQAQGQCPAGDKMSGADMEFVDLFGKKLGALLSAAHINKIATKRATARVNSHVVAFVS